MPKNEQSKLTILVVEDDWLVRNSVVSFLQLADCEVLEAGDAETAVEVLEKQDDIDVVFTDIRLGGKLNGWDVGEACRAPHRDIPVVYTSGAVITPARPVEGSAFIPKPYDPREVLSTLKTLCGEQQGLG